MPYLEDGDTIIEHLNWRGLTSTYEIAGKGTSIPPDEGNTEYAKLKEMRSAGRLNVSLPTNSEAMINYDHRGQRNGYLVQRVGFVPCDASNRLYQHIIKLIEQGICCEVSLQVRRDPRLKALSGATIIYPLTHKLPYEGQADGEMIYRSHVDAALRPIKFRVRHLERWLDDHLICSTLQLRRSLPAGSRDDSLKLPISILELTIDLKALPKLFRTECANDYLDLHLVDRSQQDIARTGLMTPSYDWLIDNLGQWTFQIASSCFNYLLWKLLMYSNSIERMYINDRDVQQHCLHFANTCFGSVEIGLHAYFYQSAGVTTQEVVDHPRDVLLRNHGYQDNAIRAFPENTHRISMFFRYGFHFEAISTLNALLDVQIRSALAPVLEGIGLPTPELNKFGPSEDGCD